LLALVLEEEEGEGRGLVQALVAH
jgi:hypothetical protein